MLQKYTESDFEVNNLDKSRLGFIRKSFKTKSPFLFNFKFITSFFFLFCNIINIDLFLIHRFFLVFWLFTGSYASIIKLKINLRLGINYYHFRVVYKMSKRKFLYIFSFLIDEFISNQKYDDSKILFNSYLLFFKNLEILTNFKLARGVYFHRIQQKFFFKIFFEKLSLSFFNMFLNSIKLYVN
jgi:hypothetical protein